MDIPGIVLQLKQQRDRLDNAIAALAGSGSPAPRGLIRRRMTAAARARIGAAKKAWWAKQKGKSTAKKGKPSSKQTTRRKPMSAAARKKLSALMKARWAERKKAA